MKIEEGDSVAVRAVKGVLAGYVVGEVRLRSSDVDTTESGYVLASVFVSVAPDAITKMLVEEIQRGFVP